MLTAAKRTVSSALSSSLLIIANLLVGVIILILIVLTLMKHFEETPEIRNLMCFAGLPRSDCPQYGTKVANLRSELDQLEQQKGVIAGQLAALSSIERSVDKITLFETKPIEGSARTMTIGTVYSRLTTAVPSPEYHYCYIDLPEGTAGETRNFHFVGSTGDIPLTQDDIAEAGISETTLRNARMQCRPFLIASSG